LSSQFTPHGIGSENHGRGVLLFCIQESVNHKLTRSWIFGSSERVVSKLLITFDYFAMHPRTSPNCEQEAPTLARKFVRLASEASVKKARKSAKNGGKLKQDKKQADKSDTSMDEPIPYCS
jgi:hypothetical protein